MNLEKRLMNAIHVEDDIPYSESGDERFHYKAVIFVTQNPNGTINLLTNFEIKLGGIIREYCMKCRTSIEEDKVIALYGSIKVFRNEVAPRNMASDFNLAVDITIHTLIEIAAKNTT